MFFFLVFFFIQPQKSKIGENPIQIFTSCIRRVSVWDFIVIVDSVSVCFSYSLFFYFGRFENNLDSNLLLLLDSSRTKKLARASHITSALHIVDFRHFLHVKPKIWSHVCFLAFWFRFLPLILNSVAFFQLHSIRRPSSVSVALIIRSYESILVSHLYFFIRCLATWSISVRLSNFFFFLFLFLFPSPLVWDAFFSLRGFFFSGFR